MSKNSYLLLKNKKLPVYLKWYFAKKSGGVTPTLKNLYLGYSRQTQTTGKNVMPINSYNSNDQRQLQFNFDLPAGTYTISYDLINFDIGTNNFITVYMGLYGATSQIVDVNLGQINSQTQLDRKQVTFTTTESITLNSRYSTLRIPNTQYENGGRAIITNIQIEAGTEATPFEQYTGGIPAPNPNYEMEIENLTGNILIQAGNKVITFPLAEGQKLYRNSMLTPNGISNIKTQVILNGTETVTKGLSTIVPYNYYLVNKTLEKIPKYSQDLRDTTLCSQFKAMINNTPAFFNYGMALSSNLNRFVFVYDSITTAEDFETYLLNQYTNNRPVLIEYELAETETVAYTDAQLQAYINLCKYFEENTDLNNYIVEGG